MSRSIIKIETTQSAINYPSQQPVIINTPINATITFDISNDGIYTINIETPATAVGKDTFIIGDAVHNQYDIYHTVGSRYVSISVFLLTTPFTELNPQIMRLSDTHISLTFDSIPDLNSIGVVVIG